ncbi:hypothetical protein [Streptomyces liliifuscus]|uniref:Uncharacterized protein n=1 Tax=Streptomyces liliifuscus TaxID=2797636 RepID=A0A7T7L2H2_9ACTN|nr:hypothetical protein [Streptomyces liliifuscus]QQM45232.1 hypothetical protein JEQ17_41375 [Streptomyces liliifuscus]
MTVYITKRGDRFHSRPDCGSIVGPQRTAVTRGYQVYPVEEVSRAEAESRGKGTPCPQCGR